MLELQKKVLQAVKSDKFLFRKELMKSLTWLKRNDRIRLRYWVKKNFYHLHPEIIDRM